MEFLFVRRLSDTDYQQQVYDLVKQCDLEFVPPLSQRVSTTQQTLNGSLETETEGPKSYFQTLCDQSAILVVEQTRVVGFLSFLERHICQDDLQKVPTIYVTTIIVDPAYRGQRLAVSMYQMLMEFAQTQQLPITTRTWSTNDAHIQILLRFGFYELLCIRDGRGKGIDTVYFRKD